MPLDCTTMRDPSNVCMHEAVRKDNVAPTVTVTYPIGETTRASTLSRVAHSGKAELRIAPPT